MWHLTREFPRGTFTASDDVLLIWSGDSWAEGRDRFIAFLEEWIVFAMETNTFESFVGPRPFTVYDKYEIQQAITELRFHKHNKEVMDWIVGWRMRLWSDMDTDTEQGKKVDSSTYVG